MTKLLAKVKELFLIILFSNYIITKTLHEYFPRTLFLFKEMLHSTAFHASYYRTN